MSAKKATAPVVLSESVSIFSQFLAEMRDASLQRERQRFRLNMARASEILAYEISKRLDYRETEVVTPLGIARTPTLTESPLLVSILRAGVAMQEGFLRYFDRSDNAFISAYRQHTSENQFVINIEYISCPSVEGRTLILLDPMIATGQSMVLSYEALLSQGTPAQVFVASIISSEQGIEHVQRHMPHAQIFTGAVDDELTARAYIVPGLGDAGDLAFGEKQNPTLSSDSDEDVFDLEEESLR